MKKPWRSTALGGLTAFFLAVQPGVPAFAGTPDVASPTEPEASDETADPPSMLGEAVSELNAIRPKWLVQAEQRYDEGVKALEANDPDLAGKKFKAALKILSQKPGVAEAAGLKDEIGALFAKLEENFLEEKTPPGAPGMQVSEQELEQAPPAVTPDVPAKALTIPVDPEHPLVKKYIAIYTGSRRREMESALERLSVYRDMFSKQLQDAGLPRELIYLPVVESECKNTATSRAGAVGLWQIMSATGRRYGLKINYWIDERRDPEKATRAAVRYLKELHDWFDDWHLALAAYNRGEYGIERDMKFTRSVDFSNLSKRRALPDETEQYVPKFMACVILGENATSYGYNVETRRAPETDVVKLDKPLDLKVAADCAGSTENELQELNPTLRLWCTPKTADSFELRIPAGTKEKFQTALARVKDWTPSSGEVKYRVKKGDVLGNIAKRYKTTVKALQRDNRIRDPRFLRPGQTLVIRPGRRYQGND